MRLVQGGKVLEAELRQIDDEWREDQIALNERIGNVNGELRSF